MNNWLPKKGEIRVFVEMLTDGRMLVQVLRHNDKKIPPSKLMKRLTHPKAKYPMFVGFFK